MKAVADALEVARSHLHEKVRRLAKPRGSYRKPDDEDLLPLIRRLVDERPTYGYRRITALANRELVKTGKPMANHKRIFRIMRQNGMLLARHTGRRKGRLHDGKVVVMRSNLRWCSDGFEISCWNGDLVRLAFIIDAHDREIIAWHAVANAGISGSMVRDMMLEAVESRFAAIQAPHALEWLTDNGSVYTAQETRAFATALNLVPCFTPIQSPESNGISEASSHPQPLPTRAHKGEGSRPSLLLEFYPDGTCYDFVALSEHYCFSMPAFSMTEAHFLISADMRSRI